MGTIFIEMDLEDSLDFLGDLNLLMIGVGAGNDQL